MNIRHKIIRVIEQPSGIIDLVFGVRPMFTNYFLTVKKFTNILNTYIDIGANKGEVIKACKRVFPEAKIYAIEPIKEHCESMKKEFSEIIVFNCGLWNKNTKSKFFYQRERGS